MGTTAIAPQALHFCGILYSDESVLEQCITRLRNDFGEIFYQVRGFPFDMSDYYNKEMGEGLLKAFVFFDAMIQEDSIADIKIKTNALEQEFARNANRIINCDPGYLDMAKVVLATTKDRGHRIYLRDGIYAETTLLFQGRSYETYPWTYPDFHKKEYIALFNAVREIFNAKRNL